MKKLILAIDVGTTLIKSVVSDLAGTEIACVRVENHVILNKNTAECDMLQLWECCKTCIVQVVEQTGEQAAQIKAVVLAGNMLGLWMLDEAQKEFTNAILWNDGRSIDVIEDWIADGRIQSVFEQTNNMLTPGATLAILKYMQQHQLAVLQRAKTIFFCKDYIRFKLTGLCHTDTTELARVLGKTLDDRLLKTLGLAEYYPCFCQPLEPTDIVGTLLPDIAKDCGLSADTVVLASTGDVPATLLGAGMVQAEDTCLILGTSCLCTRTNHLGVNEKVVGLDFPMLQGLHARAMPNQAGMLAIDWFVREFMGETATQWSRAELSQYLNTQVEDGAQGVIFHPYINHTGVLAPFYNPKTRGQFFGLSVSHTKFTLLKAVYEGLAFAVADCLKELQVSSGSTITVVGGGANDVALCQLIADVTGMHLRKISNTEIGVLGLVYLAGIALGEWESIEQAVQSNQYEAICYSPNVVRHASYQPVLKKYVRLQKYLESEGVEE